MSPYLAMIKREVLEHRTGFVITPLAVGGIVLLTVVLSLLVFDTATISMGDIDGQVSSFGDVLEKVAEKTDVERHGLVLAIIYALALPLALIMPFVIIFTLLGCLYEERRDRSFLFWKSMPVSDVDEVLVKLFSALIVAPAIFLVIIAVLQLSFLVIASVIGLVQGGPVGMLWPIINIVGSWLSVAVYHIFYVLWALPVFAWLLLASAYAPKAPLLYATVPPIVVHIVLQIALGSSHFGRWIGERLAGSRVAEALSYRTIDGPEDIIRLITVPDIGALVGYSFSAPSFWVGLALSAGMVWGAIYLRRFNV